MTRVAGGWMPAARTSSAIVRSVPVTTRCSGQKAIWIIAAGVSGLRPHSIRRLAMLATLCTAIRNTSVSSRASAPQSIRLLPSHSWPVTIVTDDAFARWVTAMPAESGAASDDDTPGTTSKGT